MANYRLLGIDAGTTSLKAVLYDEKGSQLASGSKEYNLITPIPNFVEALPTTYWESLKVVMKEIASKLNVNKVEVDALAVSSQAESFVVLDREGQPLRNVIVWLDSRSSIEADEIRREFGQERVYHTTGSPDVDPTWASTKLLWMRKNELDIFKKISKFLLVEDYLIYKMTSKFATNGALYCSSLLYDIIHNSWWKDMLDFLKIDENILPKLYPSGVEVGRLTDKAKKELKISKNSIVVSGGMDQACGCIGTGNISPGILTENIGASLNVCVTTDRPVFDRKYRVPCQTHSISGKYIYLPWTKTAGMTLKWFKDHFCEEQIKEASGRGISVYDFLTKNIEKIPPGSNGVIMLPHLTGAMSPEMDENARGVLYGLNLSTNRDVIIRAIIESITYMLRSNIELVEDANIQVKGIIASGGASNSDTWNQIKADVLGKPILTIKDQDSGCLGAAILAGVGAGIYKSIDLACKQIIKKGKEYIPDSNNTKIYNQYYQIYNDLYKNLKPLFEKTANLINNIKG